MDEWMDSGLVCRFRSRLWQAEGLLHVIVLSSYPLVSRKEGQGQEGLHPRLSFGPGSLREAPPAPPCCCPSEQHAAAPAAYPQRLSAPSSQQPAQPPPHTRLLTPASFPETASARCEALQDTCRPCSTSSGWLPALTPFPPPSNVSAHRPASTSYPQRPVLPVVLARLLLGVQFDFAPDFQLPLVCRLPRLISLEYQR
jgi:hypothetical protein